MSHALKCILREQCTYANTDRCNAQCGPYVANHGFSGKGGRVAAAGLPSDYRLLTLKTMPSAESIVRIGSDTMALGTFIGQYAETFTRQFDTDASERKRIKSLYLYSESPGTGKTTTAAALLNEYLIVNYIGSLKRSRQPLDRPAAFLDVNEWQTDFNAFNRPRVPEETAAPAAARYYKAQAIAQSVPFLVMDDVGVRDASDAFRADLHAIINARTTDGLPTVYTSNLPMSELMRLYDARLADRVRDMCVEIRFEGGSNRGFRTS